MRFKRSEDGIDVFELEYSCVGDQARHKHTCLSAKMRILVAALFVRDDFANKSRECVFRVRISSVIAIPRFELAIARFACADLILERGNDPAERVACQREYKPAIGSG